MRDYIYILKLLPKFHDRASYGEKENKILGDHFARLERQKQRGTIKYVGKTDLPITNKGNFGLVVFEAENDTVAELFMRSDPAVMKKMMTAECFPFKHDM